MITIPNAEVAHRRLLQAFDTMFTEYEGCLYYSHPGGKQIKVDFSTNCRVSLLFVCVHVRYWWLTREYGM